MGTPSAASSTILARLTRPDGIDGDRGSWKIRPKYATGLCLDMPAYTDTDGKQVQLYKCKTSGNASNERWDMRTDGNTYWISPSRLGGRSCPWRWSRIAKVT
ncbi:RICIN domain-containing protein [Actinomadura sp. NTSP31]|uniref:RICIN domain-containing protein n=1 Tax=Actinomadura sp. NTSP31 TaxID=1735447 RepID=UPI0035C253FE